MSELQCLSCYATTTNGLALCDLCQRKVLADLEFLPAYFRNLARWRPGRAGSRPVPGSRVLYSGPSRPGTGDRISDTLDEVLNALTTWARKLSEDRGGYERPLTMSDAVLTGDLPREVADDLNDNPAWKAKWLALAFEDHLTSIATLEWAGEFVRELGRHEVSLRGLTEASVPGWYAGACRRCGVPTYVVPGLTWMTCKGCGATTHARDHLSTILDEARDWVARPKDIAGAIVALVDTELSVVRLYERIKKWEQRERIEGIRRLDAEGDPVGAKRYRMGDVLDRLRSDGETRLDEDSAPKTAVVA